MMAADATVALKAGLYLRQIPLVIVAPDRWRPACFEAETSLIDPPNFAGYL